VRVVNDKGKKNENGGRDEMEKKEWKVEQWQLRQVTKKDRRARENKNKNAIREIV
jgi:hypothetical protein